MTADEMTRLAKFMQGPDLPTLGRAIGFFSVPGKYLHPRELKIFWESLTVMEQAWFRVELARDDIWDF